LSFGGAPAAVAPATPTAGGFGFGGAPAASAPAPAAGGLFGGGAPATPTAGSPGAGGFSFGGAGAPAAAAPAAGGLFGAAAPAAATPAAGGLFGASAPAAGGALALGAPVSSAAGGLFGAAGATVAAPAPTSSGSFSFGGAAITAAAASAPASSAGGELFGAATASAPASGAAGGGLFGATLAPAAGASSAAAGASSGGFSFGGAAAGATDATKPAGTAAASTPALGGSLFGASTPAAGTTAAAGTTPGTTASGLLSGASGLLSGTAGAVAAKDPNADLAADKPSQLTTKVGLSAHLQALARMPSTLVPERELMAIATAYNADPHNPDYRFRHFFHNVVEPHRRVRPPGVDELKWRKLLEEVGGEHNGNGLWPVPGDGFKTLFERAQVQDAELANQREYLKAVQDRARDIERFRGAQLAEKVKTVAKTHSELSHRLLRVMRKLEGAEADYHTRQGGVDASNGGKGGNYPYPRRPASQEGLNEQERELAARLRKLQGALGKSANSLPRRVDAIAAAQRAEKAVDAADGARRRPAVGSAFSDENGGAVVANRSPNDVVSGGAKGKDGAGGKGPGSLDDDADAPPIDEAAAQAFDKIIAEQQEATRHLAEVLRNDMRDLAVLNRERGEEAAEKAKGRKFYQSYW
jgi:hypothetical protein